MLFDIYPENKLSSTSDENKFLCPEIIKLSLEIVFYLRGFIAVIVNTMQHIEYLVKMRGGGWFFHRRIWKAKSKCVVAAGALLIPDIRKKLMK